MEARPLAQVPVVRLEDLSRVAIGDQLLHTLTVLLHDPVVDLLGAVEVLLEGHALPPWRVLDSRVVLRPAVVGEIRFDGPAQHHGLEVVHPVLLPAGLLALGEVGLGVSVAPHTDGRRRALKDDDVLRRRRERGEALDAGRARADETDGLVAEVGERLPWTATGVLVVPARRVEGAPPELLHARDGRQLHEVEDPDGEHVVAAGELVAAVGADPPACCILVPLGAGHPGVEEGVRHEVEPIRDRL